MAANVYDVGDLVRQSVLFKDPNNNDDPIDPTSVYLTYKDPSGNQTNLQYGVDAAVIKDGTGEYYADVEADEGGRWYYRWFSTGTGQAAGEKFYDVERLDTAT